MAKAVKKTTTPEGTSELVKIKATQSLAGKFLLSYDAGHVFEINKNQAQVIVDAGCGEFVK